MVRLNDPRPPAAPVTQSQRDRTRRILHAAAQLGSELDLEHVQMADVAREANVALSTLYRYYPSKDHLFAALMSQAVGRVRAGDDEPSEASPTRRVEQLVTTAVRDLLARPGLARAMIVSVNAVRMAPGTRPVDDQAFRRSVLDAAGLADPGAGDLRLVRLLEQCVYGVITWCLAGEVDPDQAIADVREACRLILGDAWG